MINDASPAFSPSRRSWAERAARSLAEAGVDSPRRTADILLCHVLGLDRLTLLTYGEETLNAEDIAPLTCLLERALAKEPLAYLTGIKEFYSRKFKVCPDTLIPRPETECLVEEALARLPRDPVIFADLGTGSGCLAVTLAAERPLWTGSAYDISDGALACAGFNAREHGVEDRLSFIRADYTEPGFTAFLSKAARPALDLFVSNPPYITEDEYQNLDENVRGFEPKTALVPDPTGLSHLEVIVALAAKHLRRGGLLLMEHGKDQGDVSRSLCRPELWSEVRNCRDYAGLDRFLLAVRA